MFSLNRGLPFFLPISFPSLFSPSRRKFSYRQRIMSRFHRRLTLFRLSSEIFFFLVGKSVFFPRGACGADGLPSFFSFYVGEGPPLSFSPFFFLFFSKRCWKRPFGIDDLDPASRNFFPFFFLFGVLVPPPFFFLGGSLRLSTCFCTLPPATWCQITPFPVVVGLARSLFSFPPFSLCESSDEVRASCQQRKERPFFPSACGGRVLFSPLAVV